MSRQDFVAVNILAGTLTVCVGVGSSDLSAAMVAVIFSIAIFAQAIGRAIVGLVPPFTDFAGRMMVEFLLGIACISTLIFFACILLRISAGTAYVGCCGVGVSALLYNAQRRQQEDRWTYVDFVVLSGICVVCVIWSWQAICAVPTFRATGHFPAWSDSMYRSHMIATFAYFAERGDSVWPYHFLSYMLPAAISALASVQTLVTSTALWTPLGFICMGCGAYSLGGVLAGRLGGVASVAALLLVPDAAHYGFENAFFDFHWLQQIEAGGAFAVGLALTAMALAIVGLRHRNARAFGISFVLTLIICGFRMHIFVPFGIAATILVFALWRPRTRWMRAAAVAALAAVALGGASLAQIDIRAPHLLSSHGDAIGFVQAMLNQGPPVFTTYFQTILSRAGLLVAALSGLIYLLGASCGFWVVTYALGLFWCHRHRILVIEKWFPLAFIASFFALVALLPPREYEDPYDFQHRQFVLLYAVLSVWSACFLVHFLRTRLPRQATAVVSITASCLLFVPLLLSDRAQISMLPWDSKYVGIVVPHALIETGDYIRHESAAGDIVLLTSEFQCGPLTEMTERKTIYPEEPCDFRSVAPDTTNQQYEPPSGSPATRILDAPNYDTFISIAQALQVQWVVVYSGSPPPWVKENAVWQADRFFVLKPKNRG
ncbi:MAG TPA: hypothetical protein VLX09_00765 [Stellaceae bacterium]|nr:hypothetical protein [Stellaceae bacterium]